MHEGGQLAPSQLGDASKDAVEDRFDDTLTIVEIEWLLAADPTTARPSQCDRERGLLARERLVVPAAAADVAEALETAGAEVIAVPRPITPAARIVMRALPLTGCVMRSTSSAPAPRPSRPRARSDAVSTRRSGAVRPSVSGASRRATIGEWRPARSERRGPIGGRWRVFSRM